MSDLQQPDDQFEAALAKGLRRQGETVDECPDAETLAAYWERALAADERTHWDTHFASCERCQAQLAALARTTTEEEPVARTGTAPNWFGWPIDLRWLIPATSLAAVVLAVWVARPDPAHQVQSQVSRRAEVSRVSRPPEPPSNGPAETEIDDLNDERDVEPVETVARQELQARVPIQRSARRDALGPADAPRAEPTPVPASEIESFVTRETATIDETRLRDADTTAMLVVTSPDPSVRWRVTPAGTIERSADGGETWMIQRAADNARWLAGSAPSSTTGWIVGTGGAVVVTSDGGNWRRVDAPTRENLTAVDASSSLSAAVTTVSGRRYRTADGGATWEEP